MTHMYNHRWATYLEGGDVKNATDEQQEDAAYQPMPRYWVRESAVRDRLGPSYEHEWLAGWRNIARATDERSTIALMFPLVATGNATLLIKRPDPLLLASLGSFVSDYVARQKLAGTNFTYNYFQQIVALRPDWRTVSWSGFEFRRWAMLRVVELTYHSWAMEDWAREFDDSGPPFVWDVERRFWLRAELDAAFFHLYGIERDDVDYIMETFPIVKRKDVAEHGEYRTKLAILDIYDRMQEAIDSGNEYQTVLDPPPGEGPRHSAKEETHVG